MTEHSKLPLKVHNNGVTIVDADNIPICDVLRIDKYKANAQLIVDSVNNFAELEYKYSMALAREASYKLRLFKYIDKEPRVSIRRRISNWLHKEKDDD